MRTTTLTLLISIAPSLLAAQSTAAGPADPGSSLSVEGQAQAEATLQAARDRGLPEQPLYAVMLEGQAKGATEAQILTAEQRTYARLAAAQSAIVEAGRSAPSDAEVTSGASLLAQGMTGAELTAAVGRTPADQSLAVALDALAQASIGSNAGITAGGGGVGADASASAAVGASAVSSASAPPVALGSDLTGGASGAAGVSGGLVH